MRRKNKILVLFFAAVFLTSSVALQPIAVKAASSRTIIVPDDFRTIQAAIDNASAGDTVYVRSGNYNTTERMHRNLPPASLVIDKPVSLIGENCQDTIIVTTETYSPFGWTSGIAVDSDNVIIAGFTIIGSTNVVFILGNSTLTNNIINLNGINNGIAIDDAGSGIISSNIINSAGQETVSDEFGSGTIGIMAESNGNTTISNNIINNFGIGIQVLSNSLSILNNTVTNNAIGLYVTASPALLHNNNIISSTEYGMYGQVYVTVTYNWWGTTDPQAIKNTITTHNRPDAKVTFTPFLTLPNPQAAPIQTATLIQTAIQASTNAGLEVTLDLSGTITSNQMSNVALINQAGKETSLTFSLTGQEGTSGFCNITIPKTAVLSESPPIVYADNQTALNQGYTQDAANYYVWYTIHFSTHQVSIVFASKPIPEYPLIIVTIIVFIATSTAIIFCSQKTKGKKTKLLRL